MSWQKIRLGDFTSVLAGGTPRTSNKEYYDGQISWITPFDVSRLNSMYISRGQKNITELGLNSSSAKLVPKQSLLFSSRAPIGLLAISSCEMTFNQGIKAILPSDRHVPEYLYYYFVYARKNIALKASGTTFKEISTNQFRDLEIPLPSVKQQDQIASVLAQAENLVQKRKQALTKLDDLVQSVFLDIFGEPVWNTKKFKTALFGEICEIKLGKMLDSKRIDNQNLFPYLGNRNVRWGDFDFTDLKEMNFDSRERGLFSLKKGDLLICEGGEVGRAAIWKWDDKEIYYQKALHRARITENAATPEYLLQVLWFFSKFNGFKDYQSSVTIAHLTAEKLRTLRIPIPDIELQRKYASFVSQLNLQRKIFERSLKLLEDNFQSLLHQAFTGQPQFREDKVSEYAAEC